MRAAGGGCILVLGFLLSGCGPHERLAAQPQADLVKVTTLAGFPKLPVKEIRDKDKIAALVTFVNALPSKWGVPWYGAHIGRVYFEFINDKKSVGNFYLGTTFVGRDVGKPYSQSADKATIEELGKIVDMDLWAYVSANADASAEESPAPTATPTAPKPTRHP
jgi:hypothetical protein